MEGTISGCAAFAQTQSLCHIHCVNMCTVQWMHCEFVCETYIALMYAWCMWYHTRHIISNVHIMCGYIYTTCFVQSKSMSQIYIICRMTYCPTKPLIFNITPLAYPSIYVRSSVVVQKYIGVVLKYWKCVKIVTIQITWKQKFHIYRPIYLYI